MTGLIATEGQIVGFGVGEVLLERSGYDIELCVEECEYLCLCHGVVQGHGNIGGDCHEIYLLVRIFTGQDAFGSVGVDRLGANDNFKARAVSWTGPHIPPKQ